MEIVAAPVPARLVNVHAVGFITLPSGHPLPVTGEAAL
jgi:hypothetical protein